MSHAGRIAGDQGILHVLTFHRSPDCKSMLLGQKKNSYHLPADYFSAYA